MSASTWTAISDGTWRKELGGLEKVYRFQSTISRVTGHEHWGLYSLCKVQSSSVTLPNLDTALRDAWKALRLQFPALGLVVDGYEAVYRASNRSHSHIQTNGYHGDPLEEWAQETFLIESDRTVGEIIAHYPLRDLPVLIWLPTSSEVLLLISHWRSDGLGSVMLLNRLIELLVQQPVIPSHQCGNPDLEIDRISPSLEDAAGCPLSPTPGIIATADRISTTFREKAIKSIGVAYKGDHTTKPGKPSIEAVVFTAGSSKSLVDACKVRKITVSAAIHTALAETLFELTSSENVTEYSTIMSVNMRPYLQKPFNSAAHACRTYVTSITPTVQKGASFDSSTVSLTQLFKNWHSEEISQALRELYKGASQALLSPPFRPAGPPPNPPSGILHSNLGVIDRYLEARFGDGAVEVSKFRFGVSMMSRQMLLYPWSFRGELNLSINYNDAYYDVSSPQLILERIQQRLEKELGVSLEKIT